MSDDFRINSPGDEQPRCSIRKLSRGFGFCSARRSCSDCPRAKLDGRSPQRIEPGDTVKTITGAFATVESFDERRGFRTGFIWLRTREGLRRFLLTAVTLHSKKAAYKAVV